MKEPNPLEIQKEFRRKGGKLSKYMDLILGEKSLWALLKYELITSMAGNWPGAAGLVLRSRLYPLLLGSTGRNVTFGRGIVLRHPKKIFIGNDVVVDDACVLDAKGKTNRGISIGNGVFLGRNTILNCKNGDIVLGDNANMGFHCTVFSASRVEVGPDQLIAAYVYLVGGTHRFDDPAVPVLHQPRESKGIFVGQGGWLGAHVTVFDGVRIGKHAVIGAGSVVNRDVPDFAVEAGVPARLIQDRSKKVRSKQPSKTVTVAIINYNGETVLEDTFRSAFALKYPRIRDVVLVDNKSTDRSVAMVRKSFPKAKILEMDGNTGACTARNAILRSSASDLVFLLDKDVSFGPDVLGQLVEAFERHPDAGIVSAQICFHDQPEKIQYNGADIHFVGGAIQNKNVLADSVEVGAVTAIGMLVDRKKALDIGLFDDDFFYGWEDGDFSFRSTLAGYPVLVVPDAKVYHKKAKRGLFWVHYQVRNRLWFIMKTYNWRTLLVTLPALLLYQLAIFAFLISKGQGLGYVRGVWLAFAALPAVLAKRRAFMKIKRKRDRSVLSAKGIDLMGDVGMKGFKKIIADFLNLFFKAYWALTRWMVK